MRSRLRIPILRGGSGQPLRLSQIEKAELLRIHSFMRKLRDRFPDARLVISGPSLRVTLPIPDDLEEFEAIISSLANRIRVIVLLWSPRISSYLDLCANLLAACENHLVVEGDSDLVEEVARLWGEG
ncbi:MAG: hypothetical protein QI197_04685 [Candidatus Korarchaeota archaeon]|nr:hypothetical protein [Candidatus Korarchaeota archaeon]